MSHQQPNKSAAMRGVLRMLTVLIIVIATAFWISTGSHTGFSKDRIEIPLVDPITQIEYIDYEERFIMGVEYLALAYGVATACFGLSFVFRRRH